MPRKYTKENKTQQQKKPR